jgi:hypothetical protein
MVEQQAEPWIMALRPPFLSVAAATRLLREGKPELKSGVEHVTPLHFEYN